MVSPIRTFYFGPFIKVLLRIEAYKFYPSTYERLYLSKVSVQTSTEIIYAYLSSRSVVVQTSFTNKTQIVGVYKTPLISIKNQNTTRSEIFLRKGGDIRSKEKSGKFVGKRQIVVRSRKGRCNRKESWGCF